MDEESLKLIAGELQQSLVGRSPGKLLQTDATTLAIDFRLRDHRLLLISVNPALPRLYLIKPHDMVRRSIPLGQFALRLRKSLATAQLIAIEKESGDRVVWFKFSTKDDTHQPTHLDVVAQLTGRSANLFMLNRDEIILQAMRPTRIAGQQTGARYRLPKAAEKKGEKISQLLDFIQQPQLRSPSEAAEAFYESIHRQQEFDRKAAAERTRLKTEAARQQKLLKKLEADLASHSGADHHKRIGDLLLANIGTATRAGKHVTLIDYFDSAAPNFETEIDEHLTLPEEAARRFALYSRSKRAITQIQGRIETVKKEIESVILKQQRLDRIIATRDSTALNALSEPPVSLLPLGEGRARVRSIAGTRRYISSDGFEILVGRAAKDNDFLTFKIARPNDLWLHTADYPGSHVVVRSTTRKELPHRTIIEAAQLAAYFSQAKQDRRVDVHYTQRKFLSKPKGAAAGLVRMSRFKTITVEPRELRTRT